MNKKNTFLSEWCSEHNYTQKELTALFNGKLSRPTISRILNNQRQLTSDEFKILKEKLQLSPEELRRFEKEYTKSVIGEDRYKCRKIIQHILRLSSDNVIFRVNTLLNTEITNYLLDLLHSINSGNRKESLYTNLPGDNCYILYNALKAYPNVKNLEKIIHVVRLETKQNASGGYSSSLHNMQILECVLQIALVSSVYSPRYTYIDSEKESVCYHLYPYYIFCSSHLLLFNQALTDCITITDSGIIHKFLREFLEKFNSRTYLEFFKRKSNIVELIDDILTNNIESMPNVFFSNAPCIGKLLAFSQEYVKIKKEFQEKYQECIHTINSCSTLFKQLTLAYPNHIDILSENGLIDFVHNGYFEGILRIPFEDSTLLTRKQMLKNMKQYIAKSPESHILIKQEHGIGKAFILEMYNKERGITLYFFGESNNLFSLTITEPSIYCEFENFMSNISSIYEIYSPEEIGGVFDKYISWLDEQIKMSEQV